MIYKELKLQEAIGDLLRAMELIPDEDRQEDDFFHNIYWKANLYSFFDAEIWIGVSDESVIRRKINEKLLRVKEQLNILVQIEKKEDFRKRMKKIINHIDRFDSTNGFLTDVIVRINKLNQKIEVQK